MRSFLPATLAALLPLSLSLVACGGGGSDNVDSGGSGSNTPQGDHHHYAVNEVDVPTSSAESTQFGLDIGSPTGNTPDGTIDNQLGSVLATLTGQGFDIKTTLDSAIAQGSIILLTDFQTTDFTNAAAAGLSVYLGANPSPAPCNGSADTTCGHQFTNGTFDIASDSPTDALLAGPVVGGTFSGGPGTVTLQIALGGTTPVDLTLHNAHAKGTSLSAAGLGSVIIAGALSQDDLNNKVLPAIAMQLPPLVTRDCPYAHAGSAGSGGNNCECDQCQAPAGANQDVIAACVAHGDQTSCEADTTHACVYDTQSTGKTLLGLFDANHDCSITETEVASNTLIKSLLAPDVCIEASCTAPDALSLGLQVKAVPATINGL